MSTKNLCRFLPVLLMMMVLSGCYRSPRSHRFHLKTAADSLQMADTLTAQQQDSLRFARKHHFSQGFNFVVKADSLMLLRQQPEELVGGFQTDSFAVSHGQRLVVVDVRILQSDPIDSVWVQIGTEDNRIGWAHEHRLLNRVDPDDPISQFISVFSNTHMLIFLIVISIIAVGYLLRKIYRRQAPLVHFNDIDSFYPTLLALIVAAGATFYASLQNFAPEAWRDFYFHPSLNPFGQPVLLSVFLCSVWAMLIVALAAVDDVRHHLSPSEGFLYLCGLAAVCAFNYIIFSVSTLYYVGYALFLLYVWWALRRYFRHVFKPYVCGHCGTRMRRKGRCPVCGADNE